MGSAQSHSRNGRYQEARVRAGTAADAAAVAGIHRRASTRGGPRHRTNPSMGTASVDAAAAAAAATSTTTVPTSITAGIRPRDDPFHNFGQGDAARPEQVVAASPSHHHDVTAPADGDAEADADADTPTPDATGTRHDHENADADADAGTGIPGNDNDGDDDTDRRVEEDTPWYTTESEWVYTSCVYKTPPISHKYLERLPTVTLEHDAATLLLVLSPPAERRGRRCSTSTSTSTTGSIRSPKSSNINSSPCRGDGDGDDPYHSFSSCDKDECLICFGSYLKGDTLVSLPACGHSYHKDCIRQWTCRQCTCPYCRYEYPTDHPGYEVERQERMRSYPTLQDTIRTRKEMDDHDDDYSDDDDGADDRNEDDDDVDHDDRDDNTTKQYSQSERPYKSHHHLHPLHALCHSDSSGRRRRRRNRTSRSILLVDILRERQERLGYLQHRRTVLDQLSFSCPIPPQPTLPASSSQPPLMVAAIAKVA